MTRNIGRAERVDVKATRFASCAIDNAARHAACLDNESKERDTWSLSSRLVTTTVKRKKYRGLDNESGSREKNASAKANVMCVMEDGKGVAARNMFQCFLRVRERKYFSER